VQEAIDTLKTELGQITIIVIAHRLTTIEKADPIIVLDKGKILEQGDHDSLRELGGLYSDLLKEQANAGKQAELDNQSETTMPGSSLVMRKKSTGLHQSMYTESEELEELLDEKSVEMTLFEIKELELKRMEEENA